MESEAVTIPRVNILGVGISNVTMDGAVEAVSAFIASGKPHYVCISNVHTTMMSQYDPEYRRIQNEAAMVTPDGMPLSWVQRKMGYDQPHRVYGPDLMLEICKRGVDKGFRHFFYGGHEGVAEELKRSFEERFPGIQIVGLYSPPFRPLSPEEDEAVCAMINDCGADIVWVGLGAPKQERWMAEHLGRFRAPAMLGVGAAFDFHTGRILQAPAWMQGRGLEWLFRIYAEPKRMWRRYVFNNPMFMLLTALQLLGLKKYTLD